MLYTLWIFVTHLINSLLLFQYLYSAPDKLSTHQVAVTKLLKQFSKNIKIQWNTHSHKTGAVQTFKYDVNLLLKKM